MTPKTENPVTAKIEDCINLAADSILDLARQERGKPYDQPRDRASAIMTVIRCALALGLDVDPTHEKLVMLGEIWLMLGLEPPSHD
jgi:hypothetical protein